MGRPVGAFAADDRPAFARVPVVPARRGNEVTVNPKLPSLPSPRGAAVTADATGWRRRMALNLLARDRSVKAGVRGMRLKAACDAHYLLRPLTR